MGSVDPLKAGKQKHNQHLRVQIASPQHNRVAFHLQKPALSPDCLILHSSAPLVFLTKQQLTIRSRANIKAEIDCVCWMSHVDHNFFFSSQARNQNDTLTGRKTTSHLVLMVTTALCHRLSNNYSSIKFITAAPIKW